MLLLLCLVFYFLSHLFNFFFFIFEIFFSFRVITLAGCFVYAAEAQAERLQDFQALLLKAHCKKLKQRERKSRWAKAKQN